LDTGLKRKLNTGLVLLFLAGLLFLFAHPDYRQGEPSIRGRTAPDFQLMLDGKPARLSHLRGQVVVLNFWATWCPPCVDEASSLNALQQRIAPLGATIIGVSVDEDQSAYEDFLKAYTVGYPTYRDATKQIPLEYGTTMYPETYVIDRQGHIDRKIVGPQDWTSPDMMAYLNTVINSK